ncbi:putative disease resistance protein RGA3 [Triticum dicoccoides]|uniref:putative disease resistance protein RGA3 n=1 Tax=Triticum dicoccoides TaxID=85692 RepID=UPI000E7BB045|nr:putative disease resistance protein RGA3 [Triticum dicoccoides]XP_037466370.1 putative disease resistance protein RGA3 [Triticum dicoccoides]XP_037466371.1 putative disease resistance protein RGA3 [Triticum dicoccoides]XP_037466372.1 putative disease resistance protein RGA3 [Triticum dicoccoides]XP_037466373.1 putative disease resistance protein RGA3 [Triticum dicoccoides]XP_037466374.1 putative disease resistance protein RGA3 [Triticum dicoccoides]XP_037466375.1 putative disease resistanc
MNVLLSTAQWVVGKALTPIADGLLKAWDATNNLGLNIEALQMELLLVQATLETASRKQIGGEAMEKLLGKLRHSAHCAEDLLDELDYFRIHDELHGTYDAVDQHAKGSIHDLALNAHHTLKGCCKQLGCAWSHARKRPRDNASTPNANQVYEEEVNGRMPKLGKLLPCSSSSHVHDYNYGQSTLCGAPEREHVEETPMLRFNRVDVSERMKHIVEQMKPVRKEVTKILQCCDRMTVPDIAQTRLITTSQSIEPKLYGRDHIMNTIIHDMTKGKYNRKGLSVLLIVGPGGIGKTTLIQHIYRKQQVQNHFQVLIWVCVSLSFNLNKLLEEIKTNIPPVEGEKNGRAEELIEQRLKSKRFLLVLDDIWGCSNEDDWERLLLPLKKSQENGSMILVTTRFPAIAKMVRTADHPIQLEGIESKYFRELFHAFVFGDDQCRRDHTFLLQIGEKIMLKLKGSPLAAKTVGRLLRKDLNLRHWRRVLESKEWERQTGVNEIMPALKLSYDYLPFHLQQCFTYSALFPEDFHFSSSQLINLWIGLDILQLGARNQTFEDIGLSNLKDLATHGFFREEETNGHSYYVMHDLLHDLALQVASHDCICLYSSNVGSVEVQPSIRHLSIIIDDDTVSHKNFKIQLRKLKTMLNIKQLHTLMLFGKTDESIANVLGDLFREANALRVLHLVDMPYSVESILHNFSALLHLRYLCLGTKYGREIHLPLAISRLYHLRILDLGWWYSCCDLPKDLSNLAKLHHFYTPSDELHSGICNVGNLRLLEELKVFRVSKESEGFEPKQLEHLTELRELGIYNLENMQTEEEASKANLMEKNYLERLTLDWDSRRSNTEPVMEAVVLESLQPHRYLQELCIKGHGCPSCPTWLGDDLAVEALQSLHLSGVSWQCLPSLGKMFDLRKLVLEYIATIKQFVIEQSFCRLIRLQLVGLGCFENWVLSHDTQHMFPLLQVLVIRDCLKLLELPFSNHTDIDCFPELQELQIEDCPEFLLVPIPWTETLSSVKIRGVKLLQMFSYDSKSSSVYIFGKDDLQSLDQVLAFNKLVGLESLNLVECPPLELNHLLMLTSLKKLVAEKLDSVVVPAGGEGDVEWQHPLEHLVVQDLHGAASGKDLTELLTHLPRLSQLEIRNCKNITQLAVGVDMQQTTSDEDGLLLFSANLSDSVRELYIRFCPELVLVDNPSIVLPVRGGGGLQALRSLQRLRIFDSPKFFLSAKSSFSSPYCCPFPSSLQHLELNGVEGMGTLEPLSNLSSLTELILKSCGNDLICKGLGPLLTAGGQLRRLIIYGSPRFFAGWDPNPMRVLQDGGGEEQELHQLVSPLCSSKLQKLRTDEAMGLLDVPICSFLSSSLIHLDLSGTCKMERFTNEQEDALCLLASLQQLEFSRFDKLQHLPAGLHKLTNLKRLEVDSCPAIRSLPKDGLPISLEELSVCWCGNKELKQQCRGLVGTIPKIMLD